VVIFQFSLDLEIHFSRKIIISKLLEGQYPWFEVAFSAYDTVCFINFWRMIWLLYIINNIPLPLQKEFKVNRIDITVFININQIHTGLINVFKGLFKVVF